MLQVLAERNFPVTELIPVASEKSVGKEIEWKGSKYKVVGLETAVAMRPDIALFSAGSIFENVPADEIVVIQSPLNGTE
jgi:aspartate-semialdehyde dehydrogenase